MHTSMSFEQEFMSRLKTLAKERKISSLAEKAGVEQSNLSRALNKDRKLGIDKVSQLLEAMGAMVIFPDHPDHPTMRGMGAHSPVEAVAGDNLVPIPVYEHAGAGDSVDFFSHTPERVIPVLPRYAQKNASAIEVTGDSMEPTIKKGAIVGVIPLSDDLEEGHIYLVRRPPFGLVVKRVLMNSEGDIVLRSDNRKYPDQPIPDEGYGNIIVGKVIFMLTYFANRHILQSPTRQKAHRPTHPALRGYHQGEGAREGNTGSRGGSITPAGAYGGKAYACPRKNPNTAERVNKD